MQEPEGDVDVIEAVSAHIEKHVGSVATVLHEMCSHEVHVDIHVVRPTARRPYYTLVTSGMAEIPMRVPEDFEDSEGARFAELVICLPEHWPLSMDAFKTEENYWPVRLLKGLATYSHEAETWLYAGHTVSFSDPPEPFAPNTRMCSALLLEPRLIPEEARVLHIAERWHVQLWGVFPLYQDELDFKLRDGPDRLEELFEQRGVTELLNLGRPSVIGVNSCS